MEYEKVLGYPITTRTLQECISLAIEWIEARSKTRFFACANPHSLCIAEGDPSFKRALLSADLLTPDGAGIILASRLQRGCIRQRITGSDMFYAVNRMADRSEGRRLFFLGSTRQTLSAVKQRMHKDYPNIQAIGTFSPPFKNEFDMEDSRSMIDSINAFRPDILWVGMTAPKQEKWIYQNRNNLDVPFIGAIGAVFDFYTGKVKRSHVMFQKLGLEWLPRLIQEPKRLWRRNIISSPLFLLLFLQYRWTTRR